MRPRLAPILLVVLLLAGGVFLYLRRPHSAAPSNAPAPRQQRPPRQAVRRSCSATSSPRASHPIARSSISASPSKLARRLDRWHDARSHGFRRNCGRLLPAASLGVARRPIKEGCARRDGRHGWPNQEAHTSGAASHSRVCCSPVLARRRMAAHDYETLEVRRTTPSQSDRCRVGRPSGPSYVMDTAS